MSAWFGFRKVYADLVTPDGDLAVLSLSEVALAGVRTRRASLERYRPDGPLPTIFGTAAPRVDPSTALADLAVERGSDRWVLEVEVEHGAWTPSRPCPARTLHWRVLAARTRARLRGPDGTWAGTGYVDWVELGEPTRWMGLRRLQWGRAHLPDRTWIVEDLRVGDDARWQIAAEVGADGAVEHTPSAALSEDGVVALGDGPPLALRGVVVHEGDALGPERLPRWTDRELSRWLGGRIDETRWRGVGERGGASGPALWERVTFGRTHRD